MSQNQVLLKDEVITKGRGDRRAVLDYKMGIVYQYDNPANVTAVYQSGKGWAILNEPWYNAGGWGSGSSGDAQGHRLMANSLGLLQAIDARVYRLNSDQWLTESEINDHNKRAQKVMDEIKILTANLKKIDKSGYTSTKAPDLIEYKLLRGGSSLKGTDVLKDCRNSESAVKTFIDGKGKPVTIGEYSIKPNIVTIGQTTVAYRDAKKQVFLNSATIPLSGFERNFLGSQSIIQKKIRDVATFAIPFNVLAAAKLKIQDTRIIEQGPEEDFKIKSAVYNYSSELEDRHFTGAMLLENDGRKFFMDIDREEIKHQIFNVFFVEVDSKVKTIVQAYESMKPELVREAEKQGLKVERQGEWFFIPTEQSISILKKQLVPYMPPSYNKSEVVYRAQLRHGKGRPNDVYKPANMQGMADNIVCGVVSHTGREHRDLNLGVKFGGKNVEKMSEIMNNYTHEDQNKKVELKLWQVVPNTTVGNFTIEGDVD